MVSMLVWGVVGAAGLLVALSFVMDYLDDRDAGAAARGTGQRVQSVTESAAKGSRLFVIGLAGLGASLAMEMLQLAAGLNDILGGAPVLIGHLLFGLLTFLGLEGLIPMSQMLLGWTFVTITLIALILRFGDGGGDG